MLKWIKLLCLFFVMDICPLFCYSQTIDVVDFRRSKHVWPFRKNYQTDKKYAWLDFQTSEEGFTFCANGNVPVEAQMGKGYLTLLLPHKTSFVVISHDKLGQYTWKVPKRPLKKKRHYKASLLTYDEGEAYQLEKQWVSFNISPSSAWLYVDSTRITTQTGIVELLLPLGKHHYRIESPFYDAVEDTFLLTDKGTLKIPIDMRPAYSYLTVTTPFSNAEIWIDDCFVGQGKATSQRLMEGMHELVVVLNKTICYKGQIRVNKSDKQNICIEKEDFRPFILSAIEGNALNPIISDSMEAKSISAPISIYVSHENEEILINRKVVASGKWTGNLPLGKYAIQSKKKTLESPVVWLHVNNSHPQELWLPTYHVNYGLLSVQCNVSEAEIWIDGEMKGKTPTILDSLPTNKQLELQLRKSGYKTLYKQIVLLKNNLLELNFILKKKR